MPQTRIHATTNEHSARALLGPLETWFELEGCPVSAFEDPDDPSAWSISVYVDSGQADRLCVEIEKIARENGIELDFACEPVPEIDWVAHTLRDLSSVRAGRFIVHGSHERNVPRPHQIAIEIDAGLAFGTGHHGTTAGCLDMLSMVLKKRRFHNVLDLGTGSGVLAIAAAKTTTAHVLASDIDPVATRTAQENARINGVQAHVECITARGFVHPRFAGQQPFDLVIANILARPLQTLAHDLVRHTAVGGTVILSGLLPHQHAPLVATFRAQGLFLVRSHLRDGWLVLVLEKS